MLGENEGIAYVGIVSLMHISGLFDAVSRKLMHLILPVNESKVMFIVWAHDFSSLKKKNEDEIRK